MTKTQAAASGRPKIAPEIDPTVPDTWRAIDHVLGGTAHFESDRAVAKYAFAGVGKEDRLS